VTEKTADNILVIGIGNEYRGDDEVGLLVARALAASGLEKVQVLELPGEGTELLEAWRNRDHVIVVDACQSGAAIGTITQIDVNASPLPSGFFSYSTHAFGLAEAVETSRNLGILPQKMTVFAIEGKNFAQGAPLTAGVEAAAGQVSMRVADELRNRKR